MLIRTDRKEYQNHQLAIGTPLGLEESLLWLPAVLKEVIASKHPLPVHPPVDLIDDAPEFTVGKSLCRGNRASQEKRVVNRGGRASGFTLSSLPVDELVEEAALVLEAVTHENQSPPASRNCFITRDPAALSRDSMGTEPEARGSDARRVP